MTVFEFQTILESQIFSPSLSLSLCLHSSVVPCRFRRSSSFTAGNCGYSDDEVDQERDDGGFLPSFKLPVLSLPPTSLLVGLYRYYCSERGVITSDKILSNSLNIKIWHIKPCWIPLQFMLIFYHLLPFLSFFPAYSSSGISMLNKVNDFPHWKVGSLEDPGETMPT